MPTLPRGQKQRGNALNLKQIHLVEKDAKGQTKSIIIIPHNSKSHIWQGE